MSWITTIDETEAAGELKEIYQELREQRGKVANIMKAQSLNPRAMKAHLDLYMNLMFGKSGLKRWEREMIGVAVSRANGCEYCVNHHAEALNQYWGNSEKTGRFVQDPESVQLSDRAVRVCRYAAKLTSKPQEMGSADIDALRECGLKDKDILSVNLIVSYFNFVNRIALGLGVRYTPEEVQGYKA